ncbi:helix-turn-helix domain-containing protein [Veillonella rogosae]
MQIEVLRKKGYSIRRIASLIGVHHSTVARELLKTFTVDHGKEFS